jgi:hypothetical protein
MLPFAPLLYTWVAVTIIMVALLVVQRVLESREQDWIPIAAPGASEQAKTQEQIERKVHVLTPVLHWVEAVDVLLLVLVIGVWLYNGINSVRM